MSPKQTPTGRAALNAMFGVPGDDSSQWYKENIVSVPLPFTLYYEGDNGLVPVKRVSFHHLVASNLVGALTAIWSHARIEAKKIHGYDLTSAEYDNLTAEWLKERKLTNYGGTYNYRKIRGASTLSLHSYGVAIDMSVADNGLGKEGSLPDWYIKCFEDQGFFWGGNFKGRLDPMHFSGPKGCSC